MASLYETDFYRWTVEQSKLLALGKLQGLDLENLAEEIASLGRQERQELENRLGVLIGHLLKWQYQPNKRSRSWQVTIQLQREEIRDLLLDNPSLKSHLDRALPKGFRLGLALVLGETPISKKLLPSECPYSFEQLLDLSFPDDIDNVFESVDLPKDCPYSVTQVLDEDFPVGMLDFPLPYDRYVLTFEEFRALPETKPASEYFNGRISQKPMPNMHHSVLQGELTSLINQKGRGDRLASAFLELDFVMSDAMIVPDISVFVSDRILVDANDEISNDLIKVAPDWLIEVLSPEQSVTLLIAKIKLALLHGTKLAWLVDSMEDVILTFTENGFNSHQGMDILPMLEIFEDWQLSAQDVFNLLKFV